MTVSAKGKAVDEYGISVQNLIIKVNGTNDMFTGIQLVLDVEEYDVEAIQMVKKTPQCTLGRENEKTAPLHFTLPIRLALRK